MKGQVNWAFIAAVALSLLFWTVVGLLLWKVVFA